MEDSGHPNSSTDPVGRKVKVRAGWTRFGVVFAGVGLAFFAVGMWRVDGVIAAMGLSAWLLLGLVWVVGRQNVRGLELVYRGPRRVEVAKGFDVKLELHSRGRLMDGFWLDFGVVLMGEKEISGRILWLCSNSSTRLVRWLSLKHRGVKLEQLGWVSSGFPLGLFNFRCEMQIPAEIGVVPFGRVPKELDFSGFLMDGLPLGGSKRLGGVGEWKGLREWRNGDSVRKIAWPASMRSQAAGGCLLVRHEEPPGSKAEMCAVVFHSYGRDGDLIRPDRFERALSLLCGVVGVLVGDGIPVRVLADFWNWEPEEVNSRRGLAAMKEGLLRVKRTEWVEAHDLNEAFSMVKPRECLIVISDMPLGSWEALVPSSALDPVKVSIANHEKSLRRKFLRGKAVAK